MYPKNVKMSNDVTTSVRKRTLTPIGTRISV